MVINRIPKITPTPVQQYQMDLMYKLTVVLKSLKLIYSANFGEKTLSSWDLLNDIKTT